MKVKLKEDRMNNYNGLFRHQVKALNRGETIEIDEIPSEAKEYLVEVGSKSKPKIKKENNDVN